MMFRSIPKICYWICIAIMNFPLLSATIRNGLNGQHFRVSAHHFPPYQILKREANGTLSYSGSTPNIIFWMAEKFNFTYELVAVNESETAKYGYVQAGLNQIINKEVDISTLCIVPTPERALYMDFSYPVAIESYKLLVPKPGKESRLLGPIRPFENMVWFTLFFSLLCAAFVLTLFTWCFSRWTFLPAAYRREKDKPVSRIFNQYTTYLIAVFSNQGIGTNTLKPTSFRIVTGLLLLSATVLVNSYSGNLMSSLTVTKFKPAVNSMGDLAASQDLTLTLSANSVFSQYILNSSSPTYKRIGDAVRRDPTSIYMNPGKAFENIMSLRYAFPTVESFTSYVVERDLKQSGKCRFHVSDRIPITESYTFGLKKDPLLNQLFSEKLMYLWEIGLMQYWLRKSHPQVDKCIVKQKESARQKPIKLIDLSGTFLIFGIGISLSFFCFIIELIGKQRRQQIHEV